MDSQRRHELESNDLREFLDNFKDFWDKHGNKVLLVIIIALLIYVGPKYYGQWQADKANAAYTELNDAKQVDELRRVAGEQSKVHDEAMRRGGDASLGEARSAMIKGDTEDAEKALKVAESAYSALVSKGATTEYKLVGHEGLAKVALMNDQWDEATKHYEKVVELAGEKFVLQSERAQRALDRIDLLKNPVAFSPPAAATPDPVEEQPSPLPGLPLPLDTFPSE